MGPVGRTSTPSCRSRRKIVAPEHLLAHRERALGDRSRGCKVALVAEQRGELIEHHGRFAVIKNPVRDGATAPGLF